MYKKLIFVGVHIFSWNLYESSLDLFPVLSERAPLVIPLRQQLRLRHQTPQTLHFRLSHLSQFEPVKQIDKAGSRHDQMLPKAHRFHSPNMLTRRGLYKTDVTAST